MKLKNLKGTKDFFPAEQQIRNKVQRILEETFQRFSFMPLETPIICYYDLLASKYAGGDEILKEVYKLSDQGKRKLGLRYDLTVPFAKVIGMNQNLSMPFKRYEMGKVFRDGPIKTGRLREFTQCDVDVVGIQSMLAEAELMSMAFEVFEKLNLDVYISYNNRKLLFGILSSIGIRNDKINSVILALDKIEKVGFNGVRAELEEKKINSTTIDKFFDILNIDANNILDVLLENFQNSLITEGIEELKELNSFLNVLGLSDKVKLNPFLARGLDIYTGTVYEVFLSDNSIRSSIGGGGRYDKIIGAFLDDEKKYPAVGISFGLDVIYTALTMKDPANRKPIIDLLLIPLETEKNCLAIANNLRKAGIKVDIDMSGRKLNKVLNTANKNNIPYVIIVGENEIISNKVSIKIMATGEVKECEICDLENVLKEIMNSKR
ncbi:histidine--tRNA ligase [Maledivibacter halophilus]|uniref:Histidine--tRNA ligase n=1 Tax=Maledivibacter halophilus TaxID=36842 RepID=A0A1T5IQ69_9FIRM|nr:histidine--tRNA ligase [Maledivibacter halophilus]SKC41317.1 histidyl-tRNA synthetase [Maledivibacter halophilus]